MRRPGIETLRILSWLCLALAGCNLEGTSTDTTNTLTGAVITSDGSPAARAVVTVRSNHLLKNLGKDPAWEVLGTALADSQGHFSLELPAHDSIYLEAEAFGDTTASPREIFFARYSAESLRPGGSLGILKLSGVASLQGRIVDTVLNTFSSLQVCVVGLPIVGGYGVQDGNGGFAFRLDGVPAGSLELKSIVTLENGSGTLLYPGKLPEAETKPGTVVDLGTVKFSDNSHL